MENENQNQVETEATESEVEAAFDEVFDDAPAEEDDFDLSEESEETEPGEEEPAEEETAEPEAEAEGEPEKQEEEEPKPKDETENQRFVLRVNGQDSEVDRDKVIELAQKGMDYDRVKEELGRIKADSGTMNRYKEQEAFLKELAENAKCTVEELMENTRVRVLMGNDSSLTEEAARQKVRETAASRQTQPAGKKEEEKAKEPSPEERRQAMFASFLQAYPDVKADEIPKEVWEDAGRTFDLTGAYQRHELRQLRAENEKLRQNEKNKGRSTGPRKTAGATTPKDPFDEAWDSV